MATINTRTGTLAAQRSAASRDTALAAGQNPGEGYGSSSLDPGLGAWLGGPPAGLGSEAGVGSATWLPGDVEGVC